LKQFNTYINHKFKRNKFIIALTILTMTLFLLSTPTIYAEHDGANQSGNNTGDMMGSMGNSMGNMGNSMGNMGDMGNMMGNMMGGMMNDMTMPMALDLVHNDSQRPEASKNYTGTYVMEGMFMGFPYWVKNNCIAEQTIREGRCYIFMYYDTWVLQPSPPGTNINGETRLSNDSTYAEWPWMGGWTGGNVQSISISNNMDMNSMMGNMMGGMMSGGMAMPNTTNQNNTNQYSTPMMDTGYICQGEPRVIFYDENFMNALILEFKNQGIPYSASGSNCDDTSVTLSSVLELKKADVSNKKIDSIEGIEFAINLEALQMNNNNISDIEPLLELSNLRVLNMRDNMLVAPDQDPRYPPRENPLNILQDMGVNTDVTVKDLPDVLLNKYDINMANIGNVSQAQIAEVLWGDEELANRLSNRNKGTNNSNTSGDQNTWDKSETGLADCGDIIPWNNKQLAQLLLDSGEGPFKSRNNLTEICSNPLKEWSQLTLEDKGLNSLEGVEHLTNLERLNVSGNNIRELWPIENLVNLTDLDVSGNQIQDLNPISNLNRLSGINLSGNPLCQSNYNPWDSLRGSRIANLTAFDACISGLDFTDDMPNLRELLIGDNPISQSYKITELQNRGVVVQHNTNVQGMAPISQSNSSSNFNNTTNSSVSNNDSSFYYEEEGNSRGFLFNVDEVPEWAQSMGLTDINQLLDPTVIAMFGIFITLLGTVAQMARGR